MLSCIKHLNLFHKNLNNLEHDATSSNVNSRSIYIDLSKLKKMNKFVSTQSVQHFLAPLNNPIDSDSGHCLENIKVFIGHYETNMDTIKNDYNKILNTTNGHGKKIIKYDRELTSEQYAKYKVIKTLVEKALQQEKNPLRRFLTAFNYQHIRAAIVDEIWSHSRHDFTNSAHTNSAHTNSAHTSNNSPSTRLEALRADLLQNFENHTQKKLHNTQYKPEYQETPADLPQPKSAEYLTTEPNMFGKYNSPVIFKIGDTIPKAFEF